MFLTLSLNPFIFIFPANLKLAQNCPTSIMFVKSFFAYNLLFIPHSLLWRRWGKGILNLKFFKSWSTSFIFESFRKGHILKVLSHAVVSSRWWSKSSSANKPEDDDECDDSEESEANNLGNKVSRVKEARWHSLVIKILIHMLRKIQFHPLHHDLRWLQLSLVIFIVRNYQERVQVPASSLIAVVWQVHHGDCIERIEVFSLPLQHDMVERVQVFIIMRWLHLDQSLDVGEPVEWLMVNIVLALLYGDA